MTTEQRRRAAIYAAIIAALETGHPRRVKVMLALEELLTMSRAPRGQRALL